MKTQTQRLLEALQRAGYSGVDSMSPIDWFPRITRTSARINDLKEKGYDIRTRPSTKGGVIYYLVNYADAQQQRQLI